MLRPHPKYPYFNIGRKGSVIYYAWHDIPCERSYTKPRNPRTPSQQANRGMHAHLTRLSGETKAFRQFCFGELSTYRSSHTAFVGIQMCQLHRLNKPSSRPIEAQLRWGYGTLPGANQMAFSWKKHPVLKWKCEKRKLTRQTDPKNQVLWIIWNASRNAWQWSLKGGMRRDETSLLNLPIEWKHEELFVWLLFYDPKKKHFSNDTCLHVKVNRDQASCLIQKPTLYTSQSISFDTLVSNWIIYRPLRSWERVAFRERWVT